MRILRSDRRTGWLSVIALSLACLASPGAAADPVLTVAIGGETRTFSRDALLARPDVSDVDIPADIAYGRPMRFRAVPLATLLAPFRAPADSVIETVALDGFAAHLPVDLVSNTDPNKAIGWLAIEPADAPWPAVPGKQSSAGPFYIVWTGAQARSVRSEQWPYQLAKLESQLSPLARWPQLGVDPALPATHEARAGATLFITQCLPCHMVDGAGASDVGPDLNAPMNPTAYMTRAGLHALIRDPKSVRSWPTQIMPGFAEDQMSDRDIDAVISYLAHIAGRKGK
ncbi:c-type cytochrome [Pseudorhodoplanes sp.]|uniref:c-type cytochrome n=1 Tax=Pseudorhodoplanes sp. TaxID=1934341 RepID=UPI003D0C4E84